jgi:hypothetical protein
MFAFRRMPAVAVLAAVMLSACSDDGSDGGPPAEEGLPEFTAGDAQVSADVRTAISDLVGDLGANAGATADPELAGVLGTIGAAMLREGRVTGVTATSALRGTRSAPSLVEGTWGVFGVTVAVYPAPEQPVRAYYTAVVALNRNEAAIGLKKAETEQEIINARGDFPHIKARGLLFQGRTRGWGAVSGYTQVIEKAIAGDCAGAAVAGVVCRYGMVSAGLEIDASVPLSFSGNAASGTREFALPYGDVRGYHIEVYCDEASFC